MVTRRDLALMKLLQHVIVSKFRVDLKSCKANIWVIEKSDSSISCPY